MPNFDQETIENWRRERVSDSTIPSRKVPLDVWQINTMLKNCEADLKEAEVQLELALSSAKLSRANIRSLKKKRERILEREAEMEGG
jgi:predicted ribosome quality control (RQC) complex YloA/Tae2 family protein